MLKRSLLTIALAALLASPLATAQEPKIEAVVYDLFVDLGPSDLRFEPGCGAGRFETLPDGSGFRFYEGDESGNEQADAAGSGFAGSGCGSAIYDAQLPPIMDHFHVRFNASRELTNFVINSGATLTQELRVLRSDGAQVALNEYFAPTDGSLPAQYVDPQPSFRTPGITEAQIVWFFDDPGAGIAQPIPDVLSGTDFAAEIHSIQIEYSSVPAISSRVSTADGRIGGSLVTQQTVVAVLDQATIDQYSDVNVRVQTTKGYSLDRVILPNGEVVTDGEGRNFPGPLGYDPNKVLIEIFNSEDVSWFTVPFQMVERAGAGEYTFVLTTSKGLEVQPGLFPLAIGVVLLPFVASIFAISSTARFAREAFGSFRRAARRLVIATAVLLVYYVAVMVSAGYAGLTERLVTLPFDTATWFFYIQIALAGAGFVAIYLVGHELYRITVPKKSK